MAVLVIALWPKNRPESYSRPDVSPTPVAVYSEPLAIKGQPLPEPKGVVSDKYLGEDVEVLQERVSSGAEEGIDLREQLYSVSGLAYPVRVERKVLRDPATGEEQVLSSVEMAADRLIGRFEPGVELDEIRSRLSLVGMRLGRRLMGEHVFEVLLPSGDLDAVPHGIEAAGASELAADLVYLEPDYIVHTMLNPSDPSFADGGLWGLDNSGQEAGLADVDIDAPEGWDLRSSAGEVVVAVIDTGINYLHTDLASNVWVNPLEIAGNGIDDDGNGWVDDIHGINLVAGDGDPFDDNGHGTHCAGTIGAEGNNGEGVVGVAWDVQLMGLKFLAAGGGGKTSDAIVCIEYALEMGADLMSNSWGGGGYSQALYDAIAVAQESGVAFVAAAGNAASDNDEAPSYPASYALDNVVAVASVDRFGEVSGFSNYGLDSVDLAAPGTDILSTWIGGEEEYSTISGTSMAAPHVSGVLALLLAQYPESGLEDQVGRLYYGGKRVSSLEDKVGFGVIPSLEGSLLLEEVPNPPVFVVRPSRTAYRPLGSDWAVPVEVRSEYPVTYEWFLDGVKLPGQDEADLSIENLEAADAGLYSVVVSNQDGEARARVSLYVLEAKVGLAEAIDAPFFEFFSFGDAEWSRYAFDSVSGADSIRSGEIDDDASSTVYTEVMGPGQVSFSWRLSAERYWDYGSFLLDGEEKERLRASEDWSQYSLTLSESRSYRLAWEYRKDGSVSVGQDALFVDGLEFGLAEESEPVILRQPVGGVLGTGVSYSLSIEAVGVELAYQWFKDGEALLNANSESFTLYAESSEVAGSYTVVVSNSFGEATSAAASIEVADFPVQIVSQPESLTALAGESLFFEVELEGSLPYSINWYKNGVLISGASTTRLSIPAVTVSDSGEYQARVSNAFLAEGVWSEVATLEVRELNLAPRFVKHPESGYWQVGDAFVLSAAVEGSFPFTYQWFKDGVALSGENERVLVRESTATGDDGNYQLEARNAFGVERSVQARVRIIGDIGEAIDLPELDWRVSGAGYFFAQEEVSYDGIDALQSSPATGFFGTLSSVSVEIEGPTNLAVFWKEEFVSSPSTVGLFVDDEISAFLSPGSEWSEAWAWIPEGRHTVSVEALLEGGSTVWIDQARISPAPVIYGDSGSPALQRGAESALWVDAKGAGSLTYQWYRDDAAIQGAVHDVYSVASVDAQVEGSYYVDISNSFGTVRSSPFSVLVLDSLADEVGDGSVELELDGAGSWVGRVLASGEVVLSSGDAIDGSERILTAATSGPGTLVFDLGLRSPVCCASLSLFVDGELAGYYSDYVESVDEAGLKQRAVYLESGEHLIEWRFSGGGSGLGLLQEAFLDNVRLLNEPVFARDPLAARVVEGSETELSVSMVGPGPFTYQWFKDGVALEGQQSDRLVLSDANEETGGLYYCVVENEGGFSARSADAEVTVVFGFYDALGLDFGRMLLGGTDWEPVDIETPTGDGALRFDSDGSSSLSSLLFEIDVPLGELRALELWIRVTDIGPDSLVQFYENNDRYVEVLESPEWQRVVLPLGKSGINRLTVNVRKGSDWARRDPEVLLAGFRLMEEPVLSQKARAGGLYWGDSHLLLAEVVGLSPFSYQWSRDGQHLGEQISTTGNRIRYVVSRVNDQSEGLYEFAVENAFGSATSPSRELRLLGADFGSVVGLPGTKLRTFGDRLWKVDTEEVLSGGKSLTIGGLGSLESSELVFDLQGPGTFFMNWKMESQCGADELSLLGDGVTLRSLFSSSDWASYEVFVPNGSHQLEITMLNRDASGAVAGQAWVDGLRYRRSGGETFEEWSERVFGSSNISIMDTGITGDPERDGLPNLAEYAFGFDPLAAEVFPAPSYDAGLVMVEFPLEAGAVDAEVGLEISKDLVKWYPLRSQYELIQEDGESRGRLLQVLLPEEVEESYFLRLAVYYLAGDE